MQINLDKDDEVAIIEAFCGIYGYTPRKLVFNPMTGDKEPTGEPQTKEAFFDGVVKDTFSEMVTVHNRKVAQEAAVKAVPKFKLKSTE